MPSFDSLIKAKTLLGLGERVTLSQIKENYKNMMQQWHPDKHPDDIEIAHDMSIKINEAYSLLLEYCKDYRFDLSEETLKEKTITPQEWWRNKFSPQ